MMKRSIRAILIAGEKERANVLTHRKNITIREGHRDYTVGPVLIGCHILNWACLRQITNVKHTMLKFVSKEDLLEDGFNNLDECIASLKQWYPNINSESKVTVIKWK